MKNKNKLNLSERQRQAWKLVKHEDLSYKDASDVMGISVNTLEKHLELCYEKREKSNYTLEWMSGENASGTDE